MLKLNGLFASKKQIAGLDIGSSSVKIAEIAEGADGYMLQNFASIPLAKGIIADGIIANPNALAERIKELLKISRCKARTVVTSLSGYSVIAKKIGFPSMDEESLRVANNNCSLNAGNQIVIPAKRITAQLRPEIEALRNPAAQPPNQAAAPSADDGLVDASPVVTEPTGDPVLVRPRPNEEPAPRAIPVDNPPTRPQAQQANNRTPKTAKSYTVRNGDSLWGIAKRHKVEQAALMKANGITDPKKLRSGMTLKIPE